MLSYITSAGSTIFWLIVQIVIGCILSIPIYSLKKKNISKIQNHRVIMLFMMMAFCLTGMLLPLHAYALLPIAIALVYAGTKIEIVLPLIISNLFFNLSHPYTDPGFVWRTGYKRVIFAFAGAMVFGIIFKSLYSKSKSYIKTPLFTFSAPPEPFFKSFIEMQYKLMNTLGLYLLLGVVINTFFSKYFLWSMMDFIFKNPHTSSVPRFFAGFNVVNPFFLLTTTITLTLMDFTKLSLLLMIFKPRGILLYYMFFTALAILLGTSAFIL